MGSFASRTCSCSAYVPVVPGLRDADGKLVGNLDPRLIMEEMGRVESLIDNFEREVFM